jgi:hypothetical protein
MARILDVNEKFVGQEPKFSGEVTEKDLGNALSWYSTNRKSKDSQKYANAFFKKVHKLDILSVVKSKPPQFGFVCRILTNGGVLSPERKEWFDKQVEELKYELTKVKAKSKTEQHIKVLTVNIQDRIREKAIECIGELEGQIDDMIVSEFKNTPQPYAVMHTLGIKGVHTKSILEWSREKRTEFEEVMNTTDSDLKEGYSNFKKTELKKIVAYCDQVILDCNKVAQSVVRKARKKKAKSPEQLVAKMKHCLEFKDLSLTSVKSTDIIESMQLWVYNTKTRKLGVYHAEDAGGLSVKGSSITNFSESKSVQKTLRKPEVFLPEVLKGGKVFLRNALDGIKAVESKLTGRINADTILLKVLK